MQFLHGLQDIGTEATQVKAGLRSHCNHIDLNCSVFHHDEKIAVTAGLRTKREFIFLPLFADLKRLAGNDIAFRTAQSDDEFALTFRIDGAYKFLACDDVLRSLEDTSLCLSCRDLLRIAHVHGIVLNETVLAAVAEGRPLLGYSRNLHVAGGALKQHLAIGGRQTDVAISGLGIVHPERHEITVGFLQAIVGEYLLAVPKDRHLVASALDAQFVPLLALVHLLFCGGSRCQWRQRVHAAGTSSEALHFTLFHLADGEVGCGALLLKSGACSCLVGRVNLRLCLRRSKGAALVIRVVYAYIIRCAVSLIAESKTDVHQATAPTATGQLICTPIDIHGQVEVAGINAVDLERLLVTGRRMKHHIIVHKPPVEVTVTRMNAGILFRFEGSFLYKFLPDTIVGTEIDMLEELSIEHLIDDSRGLFALDCNLIFILGSGNSSYYKKCQQQYLFHSQNYLFLWRDDAIIATQVHEGKEAQKTIVIGIEVTILKGFVLRLPESIDKLLALVVATHHRSGSRRSHQTDAMTQFAETTGTEYLITLRQCAVLTELIHEGIHALAIHEILEGLAIPALPFTIGTAPLIVERNIHRYAPRVIAEIVVAVARGCLRCPTLLLSLRSARETETLHL